MTREEARAYFKEKGLTYADISCTDLRLLSSLLDRQFMQERRERIRADKPVHWQRVAGIRGEYEATGGMIWTSIAAKGVTFTTTNAISFNRDGFIGFCGNATEENLKPVLAAFVAWCDELAEIKAIGEGGADDGSS